jgi:hypothetical protein
VFSSPQAVVFLAGPPQQKMEDAMILLWKAAWAEEKAGTRLQIVQAKGVWFVAFRT